MKSAIASGMKAITIANESRVASSIISRILSGKQEDIRAGDYFAIINSLPQQIKTEALAQLGIQERQGVEIIPHLSARELAEVIVQRPLTVLEAADLIKAIAQAIVSESAKAEHLTEPKITPSREKVKVD